MGNGLLLELEPMAALTVMKDTSATVGTEVHAQMENSVAQVLHTVISALLHCVLQEVIAYLVLVRYHAKLGSIVLKDHQYAHFAPLDRTVLRLDLLHLLPVNNALQALIAFTVTKFHAPLVTSAQLEVKYVQRVRMEVQPYLPE